MAYVITDACKNHEECIGVCPTGAIKPGDPSSVIDIDICTDCGECAEVCPEGAPKPDDEV